MDEKTTTRRVPAGDYDVTTHVQYSLVAGEHMVRLNPDAERLPMPPCPDLTAAQARELARNLLDGADDADRRNHREVPGPSDEADAPERCNIHGRSLAACSHPAVPDATLAAVEQFLSDQLSRDDMSLREIAAEAVGIATGAATFEPAEDEPAGYEPARLQAEPQRFTLAQLEAGCPICGIEEWGFTYGSGEKRGEGPARCDNGHEWIVQPAR
jgi:hypothetical protein